MEHASPTSTPARAVAPTQDACTRIRRYLEHGAPWDACDAFRMDVEGHPDDAELLYWGALAHARAGAAHRSHVLLDRAEAATPRADVRLLVEILSLRGRLWKDEFHRAPEAPGAAESARRARREYLAAYALHGDAYPGINAASLAALLGERVEATRLAREIVARLPSPDHRTSWDRATAGEAHLLLGDLAAARTCYAEAVASAPGDAGSVATMRRQMRLLARALPEAASLLEAVPATAVVAFAGHMIDAPGRTTARFPAALAPSVGAAIRAELARLHEPVIYTSAACGADLLLIEAAQAMGAEVNVVLPFDREDFVRTSVAFAGDEWVARFDAALGGAARVIFATEEGYLGDDVLFDYAALLLEGLAMLRATQLETSPSLLCVLDADSTRGLGGTHASFERWQRHAGVAHKIDLGKLRDAADPATLSPPSGKAQPAPVVAAAYVDGRPQRTLKTLLFADFAGYSRLHDAFAPLFQSRFLEIVATEIATSRVKPLDSKTWGDGLYVVFESVQDGAEFASRLQARMLAVDWQATGLAETSQIRIALHAGPVFRAYDPIMGRDGFFGSSVTRAARIEPVTPPGEVYASEPFAAALVASGVDRFTLEYVGRLALAKGYGESRIYRLDKR